MQAVLGVFVNHCFLGVNRVRMLCVALVDATQALLM